jgi:hypothetical protein
MTTATHCPHGHALEGDNIRVGVTKGRPYRMCVACKRRRNQAYQRRHRAERATQLNAWKVIERGLHRGFLAKGPCQVCGATRAHAHHPNGYEGVTVLDVVWLCPKHHVDAHRQPADNEAAE